MTRNREEDDVTLLKFKMEQDLFHALTNHNNGKNSFATDHRQNRRRMASFVLLSIMGLGLCLLGYSNFYPPNVALFWDTPLNLNRSFIHHWIRSRMGRGAASKSVDEVRGCNFPRLKPFSPEISEFIKEPLNVDCFLHHPLRFRSNFRNQLLPAVETAKGETCCYKTLKRENESDQNVKYSKLCYPVSLTKATDIPPDHEFISLRCSRPAPNSSLHKTTPITTHKDMFAFVHLKPDVEERIQRYNDAHPGQEDRLSVIILGLDAQSHMNFIRQMPRSHSFLVHNLSAIGLSGYTKVGDNTFPNVIPLLTGLSVKELQERCWPSAKSSYFDSCPFIWKSYASSGYRTSFAEDSIWMGTFSYEKKGFVVSPSDYYLHPMALLMSKKIGHETWGNAKLCYGPRLAFEILLDYLVKTAVTFETGKKPYFQYIWANSLFHDYLNNPKLGDELLSLTLDYLKREGALDHSLLVVMSDHGARWGGIRATYQGKVEERMPAAYLAFPSWFRNKYRDEMEALDENARSSLTTPFDIHETLLHILNIGRGRRSWSNKGGVGHSLLVPIGRARNCGDAGVESHWCVCHSLVEVPTNSTLVSGAADWVVGKINEALKPWRKICAKLSLERVTGAMQKVEEEQNDEETLPMETDISISNLTRSTTKRIQLQLTLITSPSEAVFEATVNGEKLLDNLNLGWRWKLSGEISRLNLYRQESSCVRDAVGQKYCYCRQRVEEQIV